MTMRTFPDIRELDQLVAELIERTAREAAPSDLEGDALVAHCALIALRNWGPAHLEMACRVARERFGRDDKAAAKIVFQEIARAAAERVENRRRRGP